MNYIARKCKENPEKTQSLQAHLLSVADLAGRFAAVFGAERAGYLVGLLHDYGKSSKEFQARINSGGPKCDHSTAGAALFFDPSHACINELAEKEKVRGLAYVIAGHHTGLDVNLDQRIKPDKQRPRPHPDRAWLDERSLYLSNLNTKALALPPPKSSSWMLWLRMLFSCLVDADRLDAEAFDRECSTSSLEPEAVDFAQLLQKLEAYLAKLPLGDNESLKRVRLALQDSCRHAAKQEPGIFTLSAITGAGKTLASMLFALNHALHHKKERIIYVIPAITITEQVAELFRGIFGENWVLEHHSQVDREKCEPKQSDAELVDDAQERSLRLAIENWSAPIIVTTSVQFFESLCSAKPSKARKIHNIANAVVVFDEVQALPVEFLDLIIEMLKQLSEVFGATLLLMSATMPSWKGLENTVMVGAELSPLYKDLESVTFVVENELTPLSMEALAENLIKHDSCLCIVNRRDTARILCGFINKLEHICCFHLSAAMCGAHRSKTIEEIKGCLAAKKPLVVVSTCLIEAGVDLDFPIVFREITGLDSIIQAAGRCNRERKRTRGECRIFALDASIPKFLKKRVEAFRSVLSAHEQWWAEAGVKSFFDKLFWASNKDEFDLKKLLKGGLPATIDDQRYTPFDFGRISAKFVMIDEDYATPIVVPYNKELMLEIRTKLLISKGFERKKLLRRLQRFIVNMPKTTEAMLAARGDIEDCAGIWFLKSDELYDDRLGFLPFEEGGALIV